jgi:signal transduction histidine kinase
MERIRAIEALVRFARLASGATTRDEILPLLADAVRDHTGAEGVCVVEVAADGTARAAATRGLPPVAASFVVDADALGEELGRTLLQACAPTFVASETRLLVAGGNLFGAVVMLFGSEVPQIFAMQTADGLVDLAAVALETATQVTKLTRANAELQASLDVLARTEKLRALGQMAAGVSHDLKNILNPLSLHLQLAARSIKRGDVALAQESIVTMKQVVVRGVETVERLRAYSGQGHDAKTTLVSLDRLVCEAAGIARPRMAATGCTLAIREELGAPRPVSAVAGELVSALVNVVVNAMDAAVAKGTRITLRTGESTGGCFVEIEDDGPGMSAEVERRLFEPFFTTKGDEGTGLGLAMVYATVQRHGGRVTVDTELGRGTCFRLWFPDGAPADRA